jgi:hypothetical protein
LSGLRSLIFSVDTMATIVIYFVPKFLAGNHDDPHSSTSLLSLSSLTKVNLSGVGHSVNAMAQTILRRQSSTPFMVVRLNTTTTTTINPTEHEVSESSVNALPSLQSMVPVSQLNYIEEDVVRIDEDMEEPEVEKDHVTG